jgi:glutathione S-transferase
VLAGAPHCARGSRGPVRAFARRSSRQPAEQHGLSSHQRQGSGADTDGDWVLTECPAILRYIAARHPAAGLWPWDPREEARCAEWLNWLSSTIHVAFVHVRRAAGYAADPRAVEDVAATAKKTCRELWQAVEGKIGAGTWAIGERYSVADPYLLVYWTWGRGPALAFDMASDFPRWTAHARRLAARPAVQRAFASEGLALPV